MKKAGTPRPHDGPKKCLRFNIEYEMNTQLSPYNEPQIQQKVEITNSSRCITPVNQTWLDPRNPQNSAKILDPQVKLENSSQIRWPSSISEASVIRMTVDTSSRSEVEGTDYPNFQEILQNKPWFVQTQDRVQVAEDSSVQSLKENSPVPVESTSGSKKEIPQVQMEGFSSVQSRDLQCRLFSLC